MEESSKEINTSKHKNLSQTNTQIANQTPDSKTKVYQRLHGGRDVVSVRVKPELKEALKRFCREKGLSICHITEALWTAFLHGVSQKIELVNQSPTIELTLVRDVKRVRRYAVERVDVVDGGGGERFYCGLKDVHVPRGSLPLFDCKGCLNVKCREFVFGEVGVVE